MDLNEAKEFLLRIRQLGNIEKENSTSTIPTSEMKQWNDCLQKIIYSPARVRKYARYDKQMEYHGQKEKIKM